MSLIKKCTLVLQFSAMILSLVSCASNPKSPNPNAQSILILPVNELNEAQYGSHAFYYVYEIFSAEDPNESHQAVFKLPVPGDMLIVDSLPPGRYSVKKFIFYPQGTGDFTYGDNIQERDDRFRLEEGKITIFSQSLDVRLFNEIPGRGMSTSYEFGMHPLSQSRREQIIGSLGALHYLDYWKVAAAEIPGTASPIKTDKPATPQRPSPTTLGITGTYESHITGNWRQALALDEPTTVVRLEQNGNEIKGSFGSKGGKLWGYLEGSVVNFTWQGTSTRSGTGQWRMTNDPDSLEGSWSTGFGIDMSGTWDLIRLE